MTERNALSSSLNRVEISRSALRHNFNLCRARAGGARIMPMVKADGYGHGMIECARIFAAEGADAFGVAEACEGRVLREAGIEEPVFVLVGLMPETIPEILHYRLTPVVVDGLQLTDLSRNAVEMDLEVGVHVKTDVGMGRQGCLPEEVAGLVRQITDLPGVRLGGIMAHFPMADDVDSDNTMEVFGRFQQVVAGVEGMLPEDCCLNIANSGGLLHFGFTILNMARPGIALYGCYPEGKNHQGREGEQRLQLAMRFSTRVIQVRTVPAGTGLGYGQTFVTSRQSRLAVLPVGYKDGYLRRLAGRAAVLIHGQRAPVVGRISMNLTIVDVTDVVGEIRRGDEAVLMGSQGDDLISADEVAAWMDTISYEVLCLFGNLNARYYIS
ncbi:MAG: alanine racemase [Desulfobulbaceae bacterium]|nr:alanine racemase [Desulfobulbaceae bacterium]